MNTIDSAIPRELHDLIDAAAAEMTQAIPSPDFSARVLAKIDRRPQIHWPRMASGIAAMAAAALFALWLPSVARPPQPRIPAAPQSPTQLASNPAIHETVIRSVHTGSRPLRGPHAPEISADEAAWISRAVSPLSVSPAIAIDSIQPERPTIAPISVQPLVPEPIEVIGLVTTSSTGGR